MNFLGKWFTAPPGRKLPVRLWEIVCSFQEIVLAQCGFKLKDSSKSVVVIYCYFSANEA